VDECEVVPGVGVGLGRDVFMMGLIDFETNQQLCRPRKRLLPLLYRSST